MSNCIAPVPDARDTLMPPGPTNFALIIGAMKSGTTSLFELLSQHPEIAASSVKEPRYFVGEEEWRRGWGWYLGLWRWDPTRHRIALEASTAYTTYPARPGVPARIAQVAGATFRFIYVLRNPLEQITSNARQALYVGWGRPLDEGIPGWMIDTVRYAMQVEQFLAVFPRERLLLFTLEEFQRQPDAVLRRVCRFLGVDEHFTFSGVDRRYNAGEVYELPGLLRRLIKAGSVRWLASRILPRRWRHGIRALLPRLTQRRADLGRYRLTEQERAMVLEQLAPDLRRLETMHGVEVGKYWGI
jgi:hypothetical protein